MKFTIETDDPGLASQILAFVMNSDQAPAAAVTVADTKPVAEPAAPPPPEPTPDPLSEAIEQALVSTGRKRTARTSVDGNEFVSEGDMVVDVETEEQFRVGATVRGFVIVYDEAGNVSVKPASDVAKEDASDGTASAPVSDAPVVDVEKPAPQSTDDLPEDYLAAELKAKGLEVKNALGIGAVLTAIQTIHPGARKASEVPPAKRQALMDAMDKALEDVTG